MNTSPTAPRRVVLHVGAPKSGTTYLQRLLWQNRGELAGHGVGVPGGHHREMFHAGIEVRGVAKRWGMDADELDGTWARLCREAQDFPGTMIMSHEVLAAATAEQAAEALGHLDGLDVHVVYTAREVSRQLVSEWQENVKNGSGKSFKRFSRQVMADTTATEHLFWRHQNPLDSLGRWGADLPADHLHVVVAPVGSPDPTELWRRFAAACGLAPDVIADPVLVDAANQTLGMTQVRLLRRVVDSLDGRIEQPEYARIVKRLFAQRVLAGQSSPRPSCPPDLYEPLTALSRAWIEGVEERGYRVHGDLQELVPTQSGSSGRAPDDVRTKDELAVAADAIAELLIEVARRPPPRKRPGPGPGQGQGQQGPQGQQGQQGQGQQGQGQRGQQGQQGQGAGPGGGQETGRQGRDPGGPPRPDAARPPLRRRVRARLGRLLRRS